MRTACVCTHSGSDIHRILKFGFGYETVNDLYPDWILYNLKHYDIAKCPRWSPNSFEYYESDFDFQLGGLVVDC